MAKQRRTRSRSSPPRSTTPKSRGATRPAPASRSAAGATGVTHTVPRRGYVEAVALYEEGLSALQAHDYSRAAGRFRTVLANYPDEKELHERVRLYLNICEKHVGPQASAPRTAEERILAATLAFNAANYDEALRHLGAVTSDSPDNDYAIYLLAVVHARRNDLETAASHLLRAIELNPENRGLARQDPDLEPLRRQESVRAVLGAGPSARSDRRRLSRGRGPR